MAKASAKPQIDMLSGPLWNKILCFAAPVAATSILEQLFNASDLAIVGNFAPEALRTVSVAAVGANSQVVALVVYLFVGIALGANVVIANVIGRNDKEEVAIAVQTSITTALLCGVLVAIPGELFAQPLLAMLKVSADVLPSAVLYLKIYFLGLPVILLYNFEAAIFRSAGETKIPLMALALAGVLNILLNILFVVVLGMAVEGVAIATVISNAVSALILYRKLRRTSEEIRLETARLAIDRNCLGNILRIGVPAGLQSSVFGIANIVLQTAINSLGTVVMAASGAASNIEAMAYFLANSFAQACTTFVGQNFGAGKLRRCRKTLGMCILEGLLAVAVAASVCLAFGRQLMSIFNADPQVIDTGYIRIALLAPSDLFCMLYEAVTGYLRGFGISLPPAILTMVTICGVRIIWISTVFVANPTFFAIMLVYPISLALTAIATSIMVLIYRPTRRFAHVTTDL